jgi:hypothetical protein
VQDVLKRIIPFFFFNSRSSDAPCILSSNLPLPTMRTHCCYTPGRVQENETQKWKGRWKYRARPLDAARIERAAFLTILQLARLAGFDADFLWPTCRNLAGKLIGNSVAPPVATQVMLAARSAGLLTSVTQQMAIPGAAWQLDLRRVALELTGIITPPPIPMEND